MSAYQVKAINSSISLTKDGGVRVGFVTQELNEDEKMVILKAFQSFGNLTFEPTAKEAS